MTPTDPLTTLVAVSLVVGLIVWVAMSFAVDIVRHLAHVRRRRQGTDYSRALASLRRLEREGRR